MAQVIDGYKVYEDTEDAMFSHWDGDALYDIPITDEKAYEAWNAQDHGIADLIDRFIATGKIG